MSDAAYHLNKECVDQYGLLRKVFSDFFIGVQLKINLFTGSAPPPVTQPLTPLHPPRPPLGPPPVGGPPLIRPSTLTAGPPNAQPLLNSAANQEGKKGVALN